MEKNTLSRSIKRALYGGTAVVAVGLAFPVGAQEEPLCPTSAAGINGQTVSESISFLTCTDLGYSFGCEVDGGEGGSCFVGDSEFFEVIPGEGDFSWEASAERPVEVVYALEEGYGGVSCAYSYTGGATQDEGLDSGYGGVERILACANENTPPDVPVCETPPTAEQCKSAGGGAYLIGYNTGAYGEPVICPCPVDPDNNPIVVRDCNVGQGQPNNCFPEDMGEPTRGRDEVSQSVSIVEGSMCAIHCFPIDGKRICREICPPE